MRISGASARPAHGLGRAHESRLAAALLAALTAPLAAQRQFDELRGRGLPFDDDRSAAIALGDVDGDGDLDAVVGNGGQSALYLNDGSGAYADATARMPARIDGTNALALGDVDGDGDLDLVLGNGELYIGGQNRLYLNDGTGAFTDVTAARMPAVRDVTINVALGDVDGDGDLDLVCVNTAPYGIGAQIRLYSNDGSGTFGDATARLPVRSDTTSTVALGDVDGDGDLDMMVGNYLAQDRLYRNDGTGTYDDVTAARMPHFVGRTSDVALGDVDGDGDVDAVFGSLGAQNRLYLNEGTGFYADATSGRMPFDNDLTGGITLADVDGDRDLDILCTNGDSQNRLYLNDGGGTYVDVTAARMPPDIDATTGVAAGDADADGDLDLVLGNRFGQNRLYLNTGTGTYFDATATRLPLHRDHTACLALADVDGDTDLDLVAGTFEKQSRLYVNDGVGGYADVTAGRLPLRADRTTAVAPADVDGDGDLDLVFGSSLEQDRLYLNAGSGAYEDATASRMPFDDELTSAVALGDVDADGDLDLVIGRASQDALYLNDGGGTFVDVTAARMPPDNDDTRALALGDVDGDGDLDIAIANDWQQNRLYLNDGTGVFADATAGRMPVDLDATRGVALGDVDGDGDLDLVFGNEGQQNCLYRNDGTGTYTDVTAARMPKDSDETFAVALADLDEDGDLDLVLANRLQQNRLYVNDGAGTYADATAARMPADGDATAAVAVGDVDADGDLDIAFGNDGPANRLLMNLVRHLEAPFLLRVGQRYMLEAYARYGSATHAVPFVSLRGASVPVPPFGTFGLDPALVVALPPLAIPQPAGVGVLAFVAPRMPSLAGVTLYGQALVVSSPTASRLTNVNVDMLIR